MFYKKYLYLQKIYYYESIKINFYFISFFMDLTVGVRSKKLKKKLLIITTTNIKVVLL